MIVIRDMVSFIRLIIYDILVRAFAPVFNYPYNMPMMSPRMFLPVNLDVLFALCGFAKSECLCNGIRFALERNIEIVVPSGNKQ